MTAADTAPPAELARLIDAQGHRVIATVTRSGLLVILTQTQTGDEPRDSGRPALNPENARELRKAIDEYLAEVET